MSKSYPVVKRIDNNPVAGDVPTDTSGFSNVLGASDLDVQKALDSLDDILDGSNATEILYNEAGRPVGDSRLTYDDSTGVMSTGAVQLDTSLPAPAEATGLTFWDAANRTVSTVLENGVVGQHFEETFIAGQNDTGSTLMNGSVATYAGSIGNSGNIRIANTVASASEPSFMTLGIITEPIANGDPGKITTYGKVRGIQTDGANYSETWNDADILYKSSTIAGGLTNVAPNAPIPAIPIAVVISAHATNGTLLVRPTYPQALTMLTDVNGTALTTSGQLLVWDNTNGYFDFSSKFTLWHDGTDTVLDTGASSPSDFALDCGTEKTLRLVEPVYDDLPPAGFLNARIPPSNAPTWTTFLSGGVNEQYRFSVNDYLFVTPIETTHKYREGADFSLHLHWSTGQGTDGTDRAVKWEVTYTIADGNEAFASEVTISAEETIPASTVANTHLITGIGTITGTNFKIGAYIIATVKRIAATGTAPSNDPYGLALGVHVEQDTMGSRQLFIK